jgi:hypothetical protein
MGEDCYVMLTPAHTLLSIHGPGKESGGEERKAEQSRERKERKGEENVTTWRMSRLEKVPRSTGKGKLATGYEHRGFARRLCNFCWESVVLPQLMSCSCLASLPGPERRAGKGRDWSG